MKGNVGAGPRARPNVPCKFPGRHRERPLQFLGLLFISSFLFASESQLKEGNRQFKNGHYDKALKSYEDALVDAPYSPILKFNAGAAAYQAGDAPKATRYFQDAKENAPPMLQSAADYNRGNALYREQRLPDSIEAYKAALRKNPNDEDAKYNLSAVMRAQNGSSPSSKPKSGESKADAKKGSGGKNDSKDAAGGRKPDEKPGDPKPGSMSKEDAERLLEAASANEMKKPQQKGQKQEEGKVDEDW